MTWEYKVSSPPAMARGSAIQQWLGSIGQEGWELVTIYDGVSWVFKRSVTVVHP